MKTAKKKTSSKKTKKASKKVVKKVVKKTAKKMIKKTTKKAAPKKNKEALKPVKVKSPIKPEDLCELGVQKFNDEEFDVSIDYFTQAIELDPEDPNLFNLRGHARFSNGEVKKANSDFLKFKKLKGKGKGKKGKK